MSADTGDRRDDSRNPYGGYFKNEKLRLPVRPTSDCLRSKQKVPGLRIGNEAVAIPFSLVGLSPEGSRSALAL